MTSAFGRRHTPDAAATDQRWHVIAVSTNQIGRGSQATKVPFPLAHAKALGTLTTACGLNTYSWRGLLALPFPTAAAPNCEACQHNIARGRFESRTGPT
jgi:hypothetical protein